jgi:16S rRNA (adenine1518-N6/adenine1519-N6)-dimethyltransferase
MKKKITFAPVNPLVNKATWSMTVTPKKFLGQHFLKDRNIARNIVNSLELTEPAKVLEVGPGMGILTEFLLQNTFIDLQVVELDSESVTYLKQNFPSLNNKITEGDFLRLDLHQITNSENFYLIGNFPYNISSQIFFKVLDYKNNIPCCVGMIQKEVAERIASAPGKKAYGILSVLLQAYYDIEYLFTVNEQVFEPPPKVKSAVIRLKRNSVDKLDCDESLFLKVVKTGFNQRRKMLRNSLQGILGKNNPAFQIPIFAKRPEQLSVNEFVELTNIVEKYKPT